MITIKGDNIHYYDVDYCLVSWSDSKIAVKAEECMVFNDNGIMRTLLPMTYTISLLKKSKREGATVVVWSQSGFEWAEEVVKTLGLEDYVDVCISKPTRYIDDLHCSDFMTNNIWKQV